MNQQQQHSLASVCLMAAFADGAQSDLERAEIKRIVDGLTGQGMDLSPILQGVLLGRTHLADAVRTLDTPDLRNLAYEMAVCVCNADEGANEAERAFLAELRQALDLHPDRAAAVESEAQVLTVPPALHAPALPAPAPMTTVNDAALDRKILNYAILNGALELLPHSLATMAIIPLQMKMVYEIGKDYGYTLDRGHVKDFLTTVGVGLTSQVVEGLTQKVISGLLGGALGGLGRGLMRQVTGSAFSFATTYALGQAAKRYYQGNRSLSGIQLQDLFGNLLNEGRRLQGRYVPDIEQRARQVNVSELLPIIRQGS